MFQGCFRLFFSSFSGGMAVLRRMANVLFFFCRMAVFSQIAVFCAFWQDGAYAVRYSCVRTGKQQVNHDDRCGDEMRVCDFPDGSKKHERICIENFIAATWELF